jgi:hypothetical protein
MGDQVPFLLIVPLGQARELFPNPKSECQNDSSYISRWTVHPGLKSINR